MLGAVAAVVGLIAMTPVADVEHENLAYWQEADQRLSRWRDNVLGCVVHVPGHWVALTSPDGPQTEEAAAILCDSLHPQPFVLSADEVGEFFAVMAAYQQNAPLHQAGLWSLNLITTPDFPEDLDVYDDGGVVEDEEMMGFWGGGFDE